VLPQEPICSESTTFTLMINTEQLHTLFPYFSIIFAKEVLLGLLGLIIILILHGSAINHLYMAFDMRTKKNLQTSQYNRIFFHFYLSFIFIALIHILEIGIWAHYLIMLGLLTDPLQSLLFAGSCYTTVGFVQDILPEGFKTLAFFIAFTGLFSLAWTTTILIDMTKTYKSAWNLKYSVDSDND
jgi:hypothetical protein